ncbi:hypothetical protein LCGC14_2332400, partial [marine sediment metagenome]
IQVGSAFHIPGEFPPNTLAYGIPRSADGTYTEIIRQAFDNKFNKIVADKDFIGSVDNFSVRRVAK